MNNCECDIENPVKRDGTKQTDRLLLALDPTYSPIDGREVEDLLLFVQKFASLVAYYDTTNTKNSNWEAFANSDITTLIATVSRYDWDKVNNKFEDLLAKVEESATTTSKQKLDTIHQYRQISMRANKIR